MNMPSRNGSLFEQVLANLPEEVAQTLTDAQLIALRQSFRGLVWKKHPVDVRLSLPWPNRGFYLVILAGPEQRSRERLRAESRHYSYAGLGLILLITTVLGAIATTLFITVIQPSWTFIQTAPSHPTALPWLRSQRACENTGREWRQEQCWDRENDPTF